ncbi:MAG: hypothetical protein U0R18_19550 [Mycobacterium sp.]
MSARENVVYNYSPEFTPAIRYRAIPSSCAGAAETLAEARAAYRSDLSGLLRVGRRDLPPVVEHVETKVHGILVREKVGAVHRDVSSDRMLLQTLLAEGQAQQELRAYLDRACDAGVEPVVVLADPQDTVDTVLEQMTATDAVVVAYCDPTRAVGWTAIYGPGVDSAVDAVDAPGDQDPQLGALPVDALAGRRLRMQRLPHAC